MTARRQAHRQPRIHVPRRPLVRVYDAPQSNWQDVAAIAIAIAFLLLIAYPRG